MSGREAVRQVLAVMAREDVVDSDVVARALGVSKRTMLRDWRRRELPETRVGRSIRLASDIVLKTYFPHHLNDAPVSL